MDCLSRSKSMLQLVSRTDAEAADSQFDIKDFELNMGYAAYLGRISPEDSAIVRCLLKAGAVLYTRTNVPQTLMWWVCSLK